MNSKLILLPTGLLIVGNSVVKAKYTDKRPNIFFLFIN